MASEDGIHRGLLVDYGGVLTTDLFDSFATFCELEGLEPDAIVRAFGADTEGRELMLGLEVGAIGQEQFEPRVAALLGVDAPGLINRLFAGARPDEQILEALRRARRAGIRTGLVSNSWGTTRYPRDLVFVDDLSVNLTPAAGLGMATVNHRIPADTIAQLERFLGVSLRCRAIVGRGPRAKHGAALRTLGIPACASR